MTTLRIRKPDGVIENIPLGVTGSDGNGIKSITVDEDGYMMIEYTEEEEAIVLPVSLKGDPYTLTEQDKQTIVDAVLTSLPTYNSEVIE